MGKQMNYTDQYGNTQANSYWRIAQVNIGVSDRNAYVLFYGYKDKTARNDGKLSVGSKSYSISGTAFDTLYAEHVAPNGPNLMTLAYNYATSKLDTPSAGDPAVLVSFFDGAQDV
jgi:hypothetical protein